MNRNLTCFLLIAFFMIGSGETSAAKSILQNDCSPNGKKLSKQTTAGFSLSWISNPQKFSDRMEEAHATYIPYSSTADMKADVNYDKPWLTP